MFWVAWKGYNDGKALSLGWTEQLEAEAYGMHGYPTEAEAEAHPNVVPAIAKAQVNAWIFNAQGSLTTHVGKKAVSAAEKALGSATTGWTHNIEQWLIRGFEMLLGLGLIIVSLAKLAADTPAGKAAIKAGKVAAIL